jgi:acyl-CoA thioesterase FadM
MRGSTGKARTALFDGLGMSASAMIATGVFSAVVRTEIGYEPATWVTP